MRSIITDDMDHCWVCGAPYPQIHHIFYGVSTNRKYSEEDGCVVPLCVTHHLMGKDAVHTDKVVDLRLKQAAETEWIEKRVKDYGLPEETARRNFRIRYGKDYLQ